MSRLLFAIALCMGMQAATAQATSLPGPSAAAVAAAGVVQASLSLGEKEAKGSQPGKSAAAVKSSLKTDDTKDDANDGTHRPSTGAMLLASLILMTGIALRRWGTGQQ